MKKLLIILLLSVSVFVIHTEVRAARTRVRTTRSVVAGVTYSSARLSRPTNSVVVTFLHLDRVSRVSYTLSYMANGISQGAMGSLAPAGQVSDSRDLYFGTCSHGVCTPHYNISGATLLVASTLKSGGTNTKRYRIKI